jgi:hypothetical protein
MLNQSLTKRSINFGDDSAAIATTMIKVPKTIAKTPPHISGAKPRSMFLWSDNTILKVVSRKFAIDGKYE